MTGQALDGWRELEAESGADLLRITGGIDHGARRGPERLAGVMAAQQLPYELLSADGAGQRWPGMAFDGPVLFQPDAGTVDADATIRACLDVARRNGAHIADHTPVTGAEVRDDHVLLHTAASTIRAGRVVLAVGPWLPDFPASAALRIPAPALQVTQQQAFHFRQYDPEAPFPVLVHVEDMTVFGLPSGSDGGPQSAMKIPQHDGGIPATADTRTGAVDPEGRRRILEYVRTWFPGLDPEPVAGATCLYTTTPDEDFVLDRHGPFVVASPCSGHGAKFAPLLGELVSGLALGKTGPHPRFTLDRGAGGLSSLPRR